MESVRTYLLSVTAAAMISAVVSKLVTKGTAAGVIRMLCGGFMALVVLSPLVSVRLEDLDFYWTDVQAAGETFTDEGKRAAEEAISQRIRDQLATYILDKAGTMGAVLDVEVELDGFMPCSVVLRGPVSPYTKAVLESYISDQLGIGKEAQHWIS